MKAETEQSRPTEDQDGGATPATGNRHSEIAWRGWRMEVPADWRPLKIQDDGSKGSMMIGDGEQPLLLVQWRQVGAGRFDVRRWLRRRFEQQRTAPEAGAPHPAGFDATAWRRRLEVREGEAKSIWYGYSQKAGLLLECVTTHLAEEHLGYDVFAEALPSLRVSALDEPCRWSLNGVTFDSPAGFALRRRHLYLGDVALGLAKGRGEGLLLRQVYPAAMAVSRRALEGWLDAPPFAERRRPPAARPEAFDVDGTEGLLRRGWRRLPSPLGWCNPRHSTAIAAVDRELDRLIIVEHQTRREKDDGIARWCAGAMNH